MLKYDNYEIKGIWKLDFDIKKYDCFNNYNILCILTTRIFIDGFISSLVNFCTYKIVLNGNAYKYFNCLQNKLRLSK